LESMGYHVRQSFVCWTFPSRVPAALSHELLLFTVPIC
jgi:hypothetical protein